MGSIFGSLEIGRRAIHVQQKGAQVTGQNIANANTEGYSRQYVLMKALVPPAVPGVKTPPGYGVEVSDITRIKSEFYGSQIMNTTTSMNYWKRMAETTSGIEVIFQEPDETGINTALNEFFDAWQELSVNPESYAVRLSLREHARNLTGLVRDIYGRMDELKSDLRKELEATLVEVNSLAEEIAGLNKKITYLQSMGQKSNELLDQRDLCLEELSKQINIRVNQKTDGSVEVLAGGGILLHGNNCFKMKIVESGGKLSLQSAMGTTLSIREGDGGIAGMLDSYNVVFPRYQGALDQLVFALVGEINGLHFAGYALDGSTGHNFFVPLTGQNRAAMNFYLDGGIIGNLSDIAASATFEIDAGGNPVGVPGDGGNALAIAHLREGLTMEKGSATFSDFFRGMIADLGVEGREAQRMTLSQEKVMESLLEQRESISGVSLDDEMLNMVQFQHAYNAAARYMSVLNEMLTVLFNEIGR